MFYMGAVVMAIYTIHPQAAKYASIGLALLFIIIAWTQAYSKHIKYWLAFEKPVDAPNQDDYIDASLAYFRFWDRAHIYFIALASGFLFRELDDAKHRISITTSTLFQFLGCALLFIVNASLFDDLSEFDNSLPHLYEYKQYGKWDNASQAAYFALARPGWGIGLTLLSYSFMYKSTTRGFFQQMLSLPIYSPLGKLTFIGYLIHLPFMDLIKNVNETWSHFSPITVCVMFFGIASISLLSAFVLYFIFEFPFATVEKWIFEPRSRPQNESKRKNSGMSVQNGLAAQIGVAGLTENLLTSAEQNTSKNGGEKVMLAEGQLYEPIEKNQYA